ncbi:MAG: HAMP domain-containing protein [Deltaproteobacteria bacterium]|nr:HAMP domain-containing protein [Deltaproteobacteria bacterium]
MLSFRNLPIKHKLTLLSVLASCSALILACGAFVAYDGWSFRQAMLQTISTEAHIVGANSAASLLFGDPRSATDTLAALSAEPAVIAAGVYNRDGKLFASYVRVGVEQSAEAALPPISPGQPDRHRFEANHLDLSRPIIFQKEPVGIVAIRADLEIMRIRQLRYIGIAVVVLFICTLGAIGVSLWFQQRISQPILALAATAKRVSQDKDFSLRAKAEGGDETGVLVETFNEMLSRIQEQNQELQKGRDELERRVAERTTQLEAANKELESFSYSVSHDLRAPLRSIDGFSQALLEDYSDKLDEEGRDHLQRVRASALRMGQLIDDMLNLSRVTRDEMRCEPVDLTAMAQAIGADLQQTAPHREVEFVIADGLTTNGDARLLRIVLDNLFNNAWKYTSKQPRARIEFGFAQNNGQSAYFVRDDGVGFDMAYADKLFGAFQRLHAVAEFNGTGIGLATVQRIVHRHGGRIWGEGKVDEGATFYFTL